MRGFHALFIAVVVLGRLAALHAQSRPDGWCHTDSLPRSWQPRFRIDRQTAYKSVSRQELEAAKGFDVQFAVSEMGLRRRRIDCYTLTLRGGGDAVFSILCNGPLFGPSLHAFLKRALAGDILVCSNIEVDEPNQNTWGVTCYHASRFAVAVTR